MIPNAMDDIENTFNHFVENEIDGFRRCLTSEMRMIRLITRKTRYIIICEIHCDGEIRFTVMDE